MAGRGARSYTSFSGAALECSLSRIHAGIHFRKAVFDALDQGSHVGKWIFQHALGAGPGFSQPSRGGPVHGQVEDASEATHNDGIDE